MSKNTKTYLLLGLVLLIWGIIGYKVIGTFSPDPKPIEEEGAAEFRPVEIVQKDTFGLIADYRDPFLGTWNTPPKKKVKSTVKKRVKVQFPQILYTGLISGENAKDDIYFVSIGGNQYLMRKGNINDSVTLVSGSSKSIRVSYKGISRTIALQ